MASRILANHGAGGPFGKPLPAHTAAELDFILEMGARDDPDRFSFMRGGRDERRAVPEIAAAWTKVLKGKALEKRLEQTGLTDAQKKLNAYKQRKGASGGGLKPGLTRRGKRIDDAGN